MNTPISFILQDFQMNLRGLENDIQGLHIIKLYDTEGRKCSVMLKEKKKRREALAFKTC